MLEEQSFVPTFTRKNLLGWMFRNLFGALGYILISLVLFFLGMSATLGVLALASQAGALRFPVVIVAVVVFAATLYSPLLIYRFAQRRQVSDILGRVYENEHGHKADTRKLRIK